MVRREKATKPCGLCGGCEFERFQRWRSVVTAGLAPLAFAGGDDGDTSPRMRLIQEIHDDVGRRYPLGIARDLCHVIDGLAYDDTDDETLRQLADLAETEIVAAKLGGIDEWCPSSQAKFGRLVDA